MRCIHGRTWTPFVLPFKEEHADSLSSFTFNDVSQLDQGISTALATTREWRNSFIHINRILLDVFSLIPTHLSSQGDRFRASFVCRHWRRTFLPHAALWSKLYLRKGEIYAKTILERAKGSALNIIASHMDPVGIIALLSPQTTQIECICFEDCHWRDIERFSEISSGPLPLLYTLRISAVEEFHMDGPNTMTAPSLPLFRNAVNLKKLVLHSEGSPFLSHFVFPNLTTFKLSVTPEGEGFHVSQLLDFLEASPTLRTVYVKVVANIPFTGFARESIVVLPNVETFSLVVSDSEPGYEIAACISCPSARHTSLMHEGNIHNAIPREVFPAPIPWDAITRQYTKSPVEQVSLKIMFPYNSVITCSVTFRSSDATVLDLGFQVIISDDEDAELLNPHVELKYKVFHQASRTIRDHPLLANLKHLYIEHKCILFGTTQFPHFSAEVGRLFKSVGPLEKLIIHGCDLHVYLDSSPDPPGFYDTERQMVFPPIRELVLSHPLHRHNDESCAATIVEFARSQHVLGIPFEYMSVCMRRLPTGMAEMLVPWVGTVECYEEVPTDYDL